MNDQLLTMLMEAVDPARDLPDETLRELFPHDQLLAKIEAGIAADVPEPLRVAPTPIWRRVPALVGATAAALVIAITGAVAIFGSTPTVVQVAGTGTKTTSVPTTTKVSGVTVTGSSVLVKKCLPSQISEWMVSPSSSFVAGHDFTGKVIFENTGKACSLARTYIGIQTVAGANRTAVGRGSAIPTGALIGKITLKRGQTAAATISIGSTTSPSFRQMLKANTGTCAPKYADAVEVLGIYSGWPNRYFALPERLAICTTYFVNVAGGPLAKTVKVVVHG